jgi:sec-independent protein translocase protein TatC
MPRTAVPDDDDIFHDSRMSFGDHIEELRVRLFRAIKGLIFCMVIGFVLDYVGVSVGIPQIGIGRPVMRMIVEPVESQARNYYYRKLQDLYSKLPSAPADPDEVERVRAKLKTYENDLLSLSEDELKILLAAPKDLPILIPVEPLKKLFGEPKDPAIKHIPVTIQIYPAHLNAYSLEGEALLQSKRYLTTLSAQESLVVYFKVSLICGVILASPWIFYQIWAFVAAGMYPHEKAYVYRYLPFSIGLFIAGILLCQFFVIPGAVKALLGFNEWIDTDPDLRLNEWLSFAILLPLVFGVSFQTPLVMFFMNRIGMFSWEDYWSKWRYAIIILAFFSALITPTPDIVTMLYLFIPMIALYMLGVGLCKYWPPSHEQLGDDDADIAV